MEELVKIKVTQIRNSFGIVIPNDVLAQLNVAEGARLYLIPSAEGYRLTALNLEVIRQIDRRIIAHRERMGRVF